MEFFWNGAELLLNSVNEFRESDESLKHELSSIQQNLISEQIQWKHLGKPPMILQRGRRMFTELGLLLNPEKDMVCFATWSTVHYQLSKVFEWYIQFCTPSWKSDVPWQSKGLEEYITFPARCTKLMYHEKTFDNDFVSHQNIQNGHYSSPALNRSSCCPPIG